MGEHISQKDIQKKLEEAAVESSILDAVQETFHKKELVTFNVTQPDLLETYTPNDFSSSYAERKTLLHCMDASQLIRYVNIYKDSFLRRTGVTPDKIFFRDCYISGKHSLENITDYLEFTNCKIEKLDNVWYARFLECDIDSITAQPIKDATKTLGAGNNALQMHGTAITLEQSTCDILEGFSGVTLRGSIVTHIDITATCMSSEHPFGGNSLQINDSLISAAYGAARIIASNSAINLLYIANGTVSVDLKESFASKLIFNNATNISKLLLKNLTINNSPDFYGETSLKNAEIECGNVNFLEKDVNADITAFRKLKNLCQDADYEHGAILFHGFELEAYYNTYLKKNCPKPLWPEKLGHLFHKSLADYGRDIMRPFYFLAAMFAIGLVINWFDVKADDFILLSFKNSLGPLILALPEDTRKLHAEGWLGHTYSFIQIALSSLIWFLIIFMIRRRFKI